MHILPAWPGCRAFDLPGFPSTSYSEATTGCRASWMTIFARATCSRWLSAASHQVPAARLRADGQPCPSAGHATKDKRRRQDDDAAARSQLRRPVEPPTRTNRHVVEGRYKVCLVDSEAYVLRCYRYIELNRCAPDSPAPLRPDASSAAPPIQGGGRVQTWDPTPAG